MIIYIFVAKMWKLSIASQDCRSDRTQFKQVPKTNMEIECEKFHDLLNNKIWHCKERKRATICHQTQT